MEELFIETVTEPMAKKERIWIERAVKIDLSQIDKNDYNPNKTTEIVDQAIKESVDYFGQVQELVVRPDPNDSDRYLIIDGEHRWKLSEEEDLFANVIHGLTEAEAKKLTVVLKETQGAISKVSLGQLLSSIYEEFEEDEFAIGLPYKPLELSELVGMGGLDWGNYGNENRYEAGRLSPEANDRVFNAYDADNETFQRELKATETSSRTNTTREQKAIPSSESTSLRVTPEEKALFLQAKELVAQKIKLDDDLMIANGQFIMYLVRNYLA